MHAASAGEAYLAVEIVRHLCPDKQTRVLITSTTLQGMEILQNNIIDGKKLVSPASAFTGISAPNNIICEITWFPFDMPEIMGRAISSIKPEIMVILETEIWPGLLLSLKRKNIKILMINARLSDKSYKAYLKTSFMWKMLSPDHILAITKNDEVRFRKIFPTSEIELMPNIKFDIVCHDIDSAVNQLPVSSSNYLSLLKYPMAIFVSVRREEEEDIERIITELFHQFPDQIVGLFPRHMHRIKHWKRRLTHLGIPWQLKSGLHGSLKNGRIILWDIFGELKQVYPFALTAFIGGSLKPLGGQNFIESAIWGIPTVTGPFTDDFNWVGEDIFKTGLVKKARNWKDVADFMVHNLKNPCNRNELGKKVQVYIMNKRGGAGIACRKIKEITTVQIAAK